jgi:hypothetical protein
MMTFLRDSASGETKRANFDSQALLVITLLLVGLYSPTSFAGSYSTLLWGSFLSVLALFLLWLILQKDGLGGIYLFCNSVLMMTVLFLATILSPFPEYRWGGLLPYLILALLFVTNLRTITLRGSLRPFIMFANTINAAVGLCVILHNSRVANFIIDHYSAFYPELVPFEIGIGKPVLTFASHSLGAFFYYLFFLVNLETYKKDKYRPGVIFAIVYIGLGFALLSVTGLALMFLATFQLLRYLAKENLKFTLVAVFSTVVLLATLLQVFIPDRQDWIAAGSIVTDIATSPSNGLLGRFSNSGTLYSTVNYIRNYPFRPLGVGYRGDLFFGDSGLVEYYLRGSIPLLICVYGGLFVFLHRNLHSRSHARILFFTILAFELGYTSLSYFRTLYLLPVFIVYLNDLTRSSSSGSGITPDLHPAF